MGHSCDSPARVDWGYEVVGMNGKRISGLWGPIAVVVCVGCSLSAQARYGGGKGTAEDPFQIWTAEQMLSIGTNKADWMKNFKLFADIDLSGYGGEEFNVIGYYKSEQNNKPFTGVFDANGHTISHFTYDSSGVDYIGIFGYVYGDTAEIKNFVLTDPNVNALNGLYVGSLVGLMLEGTITNCNLVGGVVSGGARVGGLIGNCGYGTAVSDSSAECDVYGYSSVGGLIGAIYYEVTVSDCYSIGQISANGNYVGGLIGSANYETIISHCHSSGSVSGSLSYVGGLVGKNIRGDILSSYSNSIVLGGSYTGGLLGHNEDAEGAARLLNCHATGSVTSSGFYVGGLLGYSGTVFLDGTVIVSNCYATGNVSASENFVGGLVGYNFGNVYNSYATGQVTGKHVVGGLVAAHQTTETISNCYSTGSVSGVEHVGGLLGSTSGGIVENCYSTGDVNGVKYVGGLMGNNYDFGNVSACFWDTDTQTHGVTESIGLNSGTATNVAGLTTEQMKIRATFTAVGWDFVSETANGTEDSWTIHDTVDYPKFVWELVNFIGWYEVDFLDFAFFANHWMDYNCGVTNNCDGADLDFSDKVDGADLKIFCEHWIEGMGN